LCQKFPGDDFYASYGDKIQYQPKKYEGKRDTQK